jgi:hypothetical protein
VSDGAAAGAGDGSGRTAVRWVRWVRERSVALVRSIECWYSVVLTVVAIDPAAAPPTVPNTPK